MIGAALVLFLCGLMLPITLLLLALLFDVLVVMWAAFRLVHDDVGPRLMRPFRHTHPVLRPSHR